MERLKEEHKQFWQVWSEMIEKPEGWTEEQNASYEKFKKAQDAQLKGQLTKQDREQKQRFDKYIQEEKEMEDIPRYDRDDFENYKVMQLEALQKNQTLQRYKFYEKNAYTVDDVKESDKLGYEEYLKKENEKKERYKRFQQYDLGAKQCESRDEMAYLKYAQNKRKRQNKKNKAGNANQQTHQQNPQNGAKADKMVDVVTKKNGKPTHHPIAVKQNDLPKEAYTDPGIKDVSVHAWKGKGRSAPIWCPPACATRDAFGLTRSQFGDSISSADNPFHVD